MLNVTRGMNRLKTILKIIAFITVPFILLFLLYLAIWIPPILDFKNFIKTMEEPAKDNSETKYLPFVPEELKRFAKLGKFQKDELRGLCEKEGLSGSRYSSYSSGSSLSAKEWQDFKAKISKRDLQLIENSFLETVINLSKDIKLNPNFPEEIDFSKPMSENYAEKRDICRYWSLLSVMFASEKKYEEAMAAIGAVYIATHHLENREGLHAFASTFAGNADLRKTASSAFLKILPNLNLSSKVLKDWAKFFDKFQQESTPLSSIVKADKLTSFGFFTKKNLEFAGLKRNGLAKKMLSEKVRKKYVDPHFDPAMTLDDKPYREAWRVLNNMERELAEIYSPDALVSEVLDNLFTPRTLGIKILVTMGVPTFKNINDKRVEDLRRTRGIVVALALKAYHQEYNKLPANLLALETWIGIKLPLDPATDEPFRYEPESKSKLLYVPSGRNLEGEEYYPLDEIVFIHSL